MKNLLLKKRVLIPALALGLFTNLSLANSGGNIEQQFNTEAKQNVVSQGTNNQMLAYYVYRRAYYRNRMPCKRVVVRCNRFRDFSGHWSKRCYRVVRPC